jgi:hypothetical protein
VKPEPPEVKETLRSLALLLGSVIQEIQEPTPRYIDWFIAKLNYIIPQCANKQTSRKLQQAVKKLKKAKEKIQGQAIHADFYVLARNAHKLMGEVLNA